MKKPICSMPGCTWGVETDQPFADALLAFFRHLAAEHDYPPPEPLEVVTCPS